MIVNVCVTVPSQCYRFKLKYTTPTLTDILSYTLPAAPSLTSHGTTPTTVVPLCNELTHHKTGNGITGAYEAELKKQLSFIQGLYIS